MTVDVLSCLPETAVLDWQAQVDGLRQIHLIEAGDRQIGFDSWEDTASAGQIRIDGLVQLLNVQRCKTQLSLELIGNVCLIRKPEVALTRKRSLPMPCQIGASDIGHLQFVQFKFPSQEKHIGKISFGTGEMRKLIDAVLIQHKALGAFEDQTVLVWIL